MSIKRVETTDVYFSWGDPISPKQVEELNKDFIKMEVPLEIAVVPDDDGCTLIFRKAEYE